MSWRGKAVEKEATETALAARRTAAEVKRKRRMGRRGTHDAGKVKLVKDVFGAEMIEEIKLNE